MVRLMKLLLGTAFSLSVGTCGTAFLYGETKTTEYLSPSYVESLCQNTDEDIIPEGLLGFATKFDQRMADFFGHESSYSTLCDIYQTSASQTGSTLSERITVPEHFDCTTMNSNNVIQFCYQLTQDYHRCQE